MYTQGAKVDQIRGRTSIWGVMVGGTCKDLGKGSMWGVYAYPRKLRRGPARRLVVLVGWVVRVCVHVYMRVHAVSSTPLD